MPLFPTQTIIDDGKPGHTGCTTDKSDRPRQPAKFLPGQCFVPHPPALSSFPKSSSGFSSHSPCGHSGAASRIDHARPQPKGPTITPKSGYRGRTLFKPCLPSSVARAKVHGQHTLPVLWSPIYSPSPRASTAVSDLLQTSSLPLQFVDQGDGTIAPGIASMFAQEFEPLGCPNFCVLRSPTTSGARLPHGTIGL